MSINIKNNEQIKYMREACNIVALTHELLKKEIQIGMTTKQLDKIADDFIVKSGAVPSFKGYRGYPCATCISVNEEVIHGIPGNRKFIDGDVVSLDIGAYYKGYHGDAARTIGLGNVSEENKKLIQVTEQSFFEGAKYAKAGCRLHDISGTIGDYVESYGFSSVREFVGHGIGKDLHESPEIPHYRMKSRGPLLASGMCICVEPMINSGSHDIVMLDDGWTIITEDGKYSAHYENTILITDGEPEFLTLLK